MKIKKTIILFICIVIMLAGILTLGVSSTSSEPVIVAFGDSLTYAGVFIKNLNEKYDLNIINAGIGGHSTRDGRARFQSDVLSKNPDIVFICFGMNDSAKDYPKYVEINEYRDNLNYFIKTLKNKGVKVILVTPNYIDEEKYYTRHDISVFSPYGGAAAFLDSYIEVIREVAEEQDTYLADVRTACDAYENRDDLLTDGTHCTPLGYSLYSNLMGEKLEEIYFGDINRDGEISPTDYILIKRHCIGSFKISDSYFMHGDINGNGEIEPTDYIKLKRHILGTYNIK